MKKNKKKFGNVDYFLYRANFFGNSHFGRRLPKRESFPILGKIPILRIRPNFRIRPNLRNVPRETRIKLFKICNKK